jgi:short-subunit dehydrogenase involved in D-alanine esterification of teichoic acids
MNQLDLNGRNAVVTGGASGLGFAIAERLNASGAKVVIWDLDGEAGLAAGKQLGGSSLAADVSDLTSVTNALQKTLGLVPTIDIFINFPREFARVAANLDEFCGEENFEKARISIDWMNTCLKNFTKDYKLGFCSRNKNYFCAVYPQSEGCLQGP